MNNLLKYEKLIYKIATKYRIYGYDQEDLLYEGFYVIDKYIHGYDASKASLTTFIYRIVDCHFTNILKRSYRKHNLMITSNYNDKPIRNVEKNLFEYKMTLDHMVKKTTKTEYKYLDKSTKNFFEVNEEQVLRDRQSVNTRYRIKKKNSWMFD